MHFFPVKKLHLYIYDPLHFTTQTEMFQHSNHAVIWKKILIYL